MDSKHRITVKTFNGRILTFKVETYVIQDGMIYFFDTQLKRQKAFPLVNCEIEGVVQE